VKNPLTTKYNDIIKQLEQIEPVQYSKTRNFTNGAVTELSPYISRGVINGKMVLNHLIKKGYTYYSCEKFIQQL
jgi:deoxyribodipyrimidine photo-lyase